MESSIGGLKRSTGSALASVKANASEAEAALRELHACFPDYDVTIILASDDPARRSVVIPVYPAAK